jgi:hypothetical protein
VVINVSMKWSLDNAELALSNLHIREGKNKTLVLNHEFITPTQGMITNPSRPMPSDLTLPYTTTGDTTSADAKQFASVTVFLSCPVDGSGTACLSAQQDG